MRRIPDGAERAPLDGPLRDETNPRIDLVETRALSSSSPTISVHADHLFRQKAIGA